MSFFLKKLIGRLAAPLPLILLALVVALFLAWRRRSRAGWWLVALTTTSLYVMSTDLGAMVFLAPLERPFMPCEVVVRHLQHPVKTVVVLGGGTGVRDARPPWAQLSTPSLVRLLSALTIMSKLPDAKLLLSGGRIFELPSEAEAMSAAAAALGFDRARIELDSDSLDTESQAKMMHERLGAEPFLLVTSASHMRRSLMQLSRYDTHPIACAADHRLPLLFNGTWLSFFPRAENLERVHLSVHEYLGMLQAIATRRLRGP